MKKMKSYFAVCAVAALTLAATALTGCKDPEPTPEPEPVKVTSVAFKATPTAPLEVGTPYTFEVTILPENAENKNVTWNSSNTSVATVSGGVVTTLAAGTTTISATAADGSGIKAEFALTVVAVPVPSVVTITSNLDLAEVNEFSYRQINLAGENGGGEAQEPLVIDVEATDNVASITLTLTTDNAGLNTILGGMGLTEPFELGDPSAVQAPALGMIGFPYGEEVVGKPKVTIPLNTLLGVIATAQIPGGINQFDIKIEAEDPNGLKAEVQTLRLKFIDDIVYVSIAGDGFDIAEEHVIKKSEAADAAFKVDIASLTGIEKFLIDIDSPVLDAMLTMAGLGGEFDLANPTPAQTGALGLMGTMGISLPVGDAVKGETAIDFELGATFFTRLFAMGEGPASFKMTIEDAAGHSVTQTLTLNLVDDMYVSITGDGIGGEAPLWIGASDAGETPVVVNIEAPQGIENFMVKIESSSAAFTGGLATMGLGGEFDLANPGDLGAILSSPAVGLPNGDAVKGQTELEFDITGFIPMIFQVRALAEEEGSCTADFKLTVTDTKGKTVEATIKLELGPDTLVE